MIATPDAALAAAREYWALSTRLNEDEPFVDSDKWVLLREIGSAWEQLKNAAGAEVPETSDGETAREDVYAALLSGDLRAFANPDGPEIPRTAWPKRSAFQNHEDGPGWLFGDWQWWYSTLFDFEVSGQASAKGLWPHIGALPVVTCPNALAWLKTGRPSQVGRPRKQEALKAAISSSFPDGTGGTTEKEIQRKIQQDHGVSASARTLNRALGALRNKNAPE